MRTERSNRGTNSLYLDIPGPCKASEKTEQMNINFGGLEAVEAKRVRNTEQRETGYTLNRGSRATCRHNETPYRPLYLQVLPSQLPEIYRYIYGSDIFWSVTEIFHERILRFILVTVPARFPIHQRDPRFMDMVSL